MRPLSNQSARTFSPQGVAAAAVPLRDSADERAREHAPERRKRAERCGAVFEDGGFTGRGRKRRVRVKSPGMR